MTMYNYAWQTGCCMSRHDKIIVPFLFTYQFVCIDGVPSHPPYVQDRVTLLPEMPEKAGYFWRDPVLTKESFSSVKVMEPCKGKG